MGAATDAELLGRIVRNPGRFVLGPTNTALAFPFGGTSLGFAREIELDWDVSYYERRDPSSGLVVEVIERRAASPRMRAILEGPAWDEDALIATFSKSTRSSSLANNTPPEVRIEGTVIPRVVPAWGKLLFVSDDSKGQCVLIRRPVPRLSLRQACALSKSKKCGLPLLWLPTPDSAHQTTPFFQIARLANLTL